MGLVKNLVEANTAKLEISKKKLVTDTSVCLFQSVVRNWVMLVCAASSPQP